MPSDHEVYDKSSYVDVENRQHQPGYYIEYFPQEDIVDKLEYAMKAMVDLERYVVMTGGANEKEGYVTLQMLVETTRNKLVSPSQWWRQLQRQQQQ